jgi:copper chaperone NosL
MKALNTYSRIAVAISALLLVSAYFVPLWQILMWAPQYPEGLEMQIWINDITGDVKIISALNHYIGMKHIEVSMFPEFNYMVYIVASVIGLGLLTVILNKRFTLVLYSLVMLSCGLAALVDFYMWGYDYGHNLDPTAPIIVPGMSYQPPLIGTKQLLNFTAFSGPAIGGWIFLFSGVIAFSTLAIEFFLNRAQYPKSIVSLIVTILCFLLLSCNPEPEPIQFGKDACSHCKMILMDNKFGAEIVTTKGKVFKFDDTSCMVTFIKDEHLPPENVAHYLIVDFTANGKLIDATSAYYVKSEELKSPMAGNVAAFQTTEALETHNTSWNGEKLRWENLINQK